MATGRQIAVRMRNLSDADRDAVIDAAGDKVIDRRAYFAERQKQADLALAYSRPTPKGGAA